MVRVQLYVRDGDSHRPLTPAAVLARVPVAGDEIVREGDERYRVDRVALYSIDASVDDEPDSVLDVDAEAYLARADWPKVD